MTLRKKIDNSVKILEIHNSSQSEYIAIDNIAPQRPDRKATRKKLKEETRNLLRKYQSKDLSHRSKYVNHGKF